MLVVGVALKAGALLGMRPVTGQLPRLRVVIQAAELKQTHMRRTTPASVI